MQNDNRNFLIFAALTLILLFGYETFVLTPMQHRREAEQQRVAANPVRLGADSRFEIRGSRFLLTFHNHAHIRRQPDASGVERFNRGKERHDRRLVIGGRPSVHAPFRIDRVLPGVERDGASLWFVLSDDDRGKRRFVDPLGRVHWLAVVMEVKRDRPARIRQSPFREHERRPLGGDDFGREAAPLEHARQRVGVPLDVHRVGRDIRQREEVKQLAQKRLLVLNTPGPYGSNDISGRSCRDGRRDRRQRDGGEQRARHRPKLCLSALPVVAFLLAFVAEILDLELLDVLVVLLERV